MRTKGLIHRIKVAMRFIISGQGNVRIMTCGNCGSMNIGPVEGTAIDTEVSEQLAKYGVKRMWQEADICQKCGAQVAEHQYWIW